MMLAEPGSGDDETTSAPASGTLILARSIRTPARARRACDLLLSMPLRSSSSPFVLRDRAAARRPTSHAARRDDLRDAEACSQPAKVSVSATARSPSDRPLRTVASEHPSAGPAGPRHRVMTTRPAQGRRSETIMLARPSSPTRHRPARDPWGRLPGPAPSLTDRPVGEGDGHVPVDHAVQVDRLHVQDHDLFLAEHGSETTPPDARSAAEAFRQAFASERLPDIRAHAVAGQQLGHRAGVYQHVVVALVVARATIRLRSSRRSPSDARSDRAKERENSVMMAQSSATHPPVDGADLASPVRQVAQVDREQTAGIGALPPSPRGHARSRPRPAGSSRRDQPTRSRRQPRSGRRADVDDAGLLDGAGVLPVRCRASAEASVAITR